MLSRRVRLPSASQLQLLLFIIRLERAIHIQHGGATGIQRNDLAGDRRRQAGRHVACPDVHRLPLVAVQPQHHHDGQVGAAKVAGGEWSGVQRAAWLCDVVYYQCVYSAYAYMYVMVSGTLCAYFCLGGIYLLCSCASSFNRIYYTFASCVYMYR